MTSEPRIAVFDFFSGCGGTSAGLRAAGLGVRLAIDNDPDAAATFRQNFPEAVFVEADLAQLDLDEIAPDVDDVRASGALLLFSACAPCQPFSRQNKGQRDLVKRRALLTEFLRFIEHFEPDMLFVENVPGLQDPDEALPPFGPFVRRLRELGYSADYRVVDCREYGIPQRRLRLILVASRLGVVGFPRPTRGPDRAWPWKTVRDLIGDLPPVDAGEEHPRVKNHRPMKLSKLNLQRIQATPEGGDRRHWPKRLLLECHQKEGAGYTDVYGRLSWDSPATGLTTRCNSLSNGRFGHPEQDRALTVREAACLQTFPRRFGFVGPLSSQASQVGNAVPVELARRFGVQFLRHARSMNGVTQR